MLVISIVCNQVFTITIIGIGNDLRIILILFFSFLNESTLILIPVLFGVHTIMSLHSFLTFSANRHGFSLP